MYSPDDSLKLYSISVLHACQPGVKDFELKESYENSFLSELHPGVALSRNTVSKFLNDLGKACDRITVFMRNRTARVRTDHHLLVDGTLKSDESRVNSLSDFSRKARTAQKKRWSRLEKSGGIIIVRSGWGNGCCPALSHASE